MKQTKMIKHGLLMLLALLLLMGTLVSCGNSGTQEYLKKKTDDGNGCQVYFNRILKESGNEDAIEAFVAASRGYNQLQDGFDDAKVGTEADPKDQNTVAYEKDGKVYTVSMDGARAAIRKLIPEKLTKKSGVTEADVAALNAEIDAMEPADVVEIVGMLRGTEVDLTGNTGLNVVLEWIGVFLRLLTKLTAGYYVWALFFFAIIVEIALLYFAIKQQKTSQKQAALRPKEMAIRKKYAGRNDQKSQQALQQELQAFYQQEGVNPLGGCLPLLIQMPIIIALYNIVINPLRYVLGKGQGVVNAITEFATTSRAAGGLGLDIEKTARGSIELLSQIDDPAKLDAIKEFGFKNGEALAEEISDIAGNLPNFSLFGLNTGLTPGFQPPYLLLLIPVLTFVAYFFSMKFTRKFSYQPQMAQNNAQMGCSNNMMDVMMPLMSVYITFITPAAVGIYWIFKCLIGMLKQYLMHKAMPMPVFTEEDFKRAEREMKGKLRPEERAPIAGHSAGNRKSLHTIDDEDELPARVRERESGEEEDSIYERRAKEKRAQEAQQAQSRLEQAKLKSDRKNDKKK